MENACAQSQKAEDYLRFSKTVQANDGLKLLEKLKLNEGDLVLDLGCGTGNLSVVIAEKVGAKGRVVAIDPDEHRIAVARKMFGDIKNIEFREGSTETLLNLGKTPFNAVFMNYVMHWIKDKKHALKNIYDVLKPGGQLAMLFDLDIPSTVEKVFRDLNPENFKKMKGMYCCEDREQIESYCKEAGFVITESVEVRCVIHKSALSTFLAWISATYYGIFDIDLVKEENLDKFKVCFDEEGFVSDDDPVGIIIATKT